MQLVHASSSRLGRCLNRDLRSVCLHLSECDNDGRSWTDPGGVRRVRQTLSSRLRLRGDHTARVGERQLHAPTFVHCVMAPPPCAAPWWWCVTGRSVVYRTRRSGCCRGRRVVRSSPPRLPPAWSWCIPCRQAAAAVQREAHPRLAMRSVSAPTIKHDRAAVFLHGCAHVTRSSTDDRPTRRMPALRCQS